MATTPEDTGRSSITGRSGISGSQLAFVIAGLLVLLVVLWLAFLRGDGGEEPTPLAVAPATTAEAAPAEEAAKPPNKRGRVETFEVFAPKDPFEPLVDEGGGGGGEALGSTGNEGTTGGTGPFGGGPSGGGTETVGGHRVRAVDVFTARNGEQRAQIQVDGIVYTVEEGESFADSFQLLSLSGDCATLLFGDDQFTLCEGEEIIK